MTPLNKKAVIEAMKTLEDWIPELSCPTHYQKAFGWPIEPEDDGAPFISEAFLYPALGKDDARSFLCRWRRLREAVGMEEIGP